MLARQNTLAYFGQTVNEEKSFVEIPSKYWKGTY
jgi:hypothetical protein